MSSFSKPVKRPGDVIELIRGSGDPAESSHLAHDTAAALLGRVREANDPELVDQIIAYADEHGIDDVAELWAAAPGVSLPGAMWRIYLLRHAVATSPESIGYRFRRGLEVDGGVNQAIAGSPHAPEPGEVLDLATEILRGAFTGDFSLALDRAAAFSRVLAAGSAELAEEDAQARHDSPSYLGIAEDLHASALRWRAGELR